MPVEIGSHNVQDFLDEVQQCGYSRGLKKRNYSTHPTGYLANVQPFPQSLLITDQSQQKQMIAEQQANKSSLYDIRMANYDVLKSLDQNGEPLCWSFSSTKAAMYARILMGEPGLILSPWYVAGRIKNWRSEGGWGAESSEFIASNGVPTMDRCSSYSSRAVASDAAQNAALHKNLVFFEGGNDSTENWLIKVSAACRGWVWVDDYDFLSHSMCGCRVLDPINPVCDNDNSWNSIDSYGEKGLYRLTGRHAMPDNIVVVAWGMPSVA